MYLDPDGVPLGLNFPTKGFKGSHFATFNTSLITPMILCSTSEKGCCPACGAPWRRLVDHTLVNTEGRGRATKDPTGDLRDSQSFIRNGKGRCGASVNTTVGWAPTCDCNAGDPVPCTVLDPFFGSGTVAEACKQLGRSSVGCDLDDRNLEHAKTRLKIDDKNTLESTLGLAEYRVVRV
jgi:hypothetical protein